jgi:hypothetical protein
VSGVAQGYTNFFVRKILKMSQEHIPDEISIDTLTKDIKKPLVKLDAMAHTYNPSYSGGRDQQDHGSKPDPIWKKTHHKKKSVS